MTEENKSQNTFQKYGAIGIAIVAILLSLSSLWQANNAPGADIQVMGVTNLDSLHLSDTGATATPVFIVNQDGAGVIASFQDGGTPVAEFLNGGAFQLGAAGLFDLNGVADALVIDADGDTTISAPTDDQIDIEIGTADEFIFTAGILDIGNGTLGRIDLDADNDTSIRSSTDDQIELEVGAADEFIFTASIFDIGNGTLGRIDLDADNDTSIRSSADDQVEIELAGADQVVFTAVAGADSAATNEYTEIAFTSPVDTTSTNTHNALTIDLAIGNATGGTNAVTAIQIDGITGDADVTETAINLGAGWDTGLNITQDTENIGLPTILSTIITFTVAAGDSGTIATVAAGEVWFVHAVYVNVTTDFDATGDDATLIIGDGGDVDGLLVLADGELQAADTEGTGAPPGWQGFFSTDVRGVYLAEGLGFIYDGAETIDYLIDEVSGETLSAGEATVYVYYTRVQ